MTRTCRAPGCAAETSSATAPIAAPIEAAFADKAMSINVTKTELAYYQRLVRARIARCRGRDRDFSLPPAQIPACGFPAGLLPEVGRDRTSAEIAPQRRYAGRRRVQDACSGSAPGASTVAAIPPTEPPSLHALRRRSSRPCSGASSVLRGSSDPSPVSAAASAPRLPAAARDRRSDCGPDEVSQVPT